MKQFLLSENTVKNNQDQLVMYIWGAIESAYDTVLLSQKPVFEKMKDIQIRAKYWGCFLVGFFFIFYFERKKL